MSDLIREFPCFSGFVVLALLVLVFCAIMVAENIALARIKVRALVDLQKAKETDDPAPGLPLDMDD